MITLSWSGNQRPSSGNGLEQIHGPEKILDTHIRKPKNLPLKDGNQTAYLLLHVHVPSDRALGLEETELDGIESAKKAGKPLGIEVWPLRLDWSANTRGNYRYFFRFSRYRRDNQHAQLIGEGFLHALALTFGPFMDSNEVVSAFRVPADLIHKSGVILGDKLVQIEEAGERFW